MVKVCMRKSVNTLPVSGGRAITIVCLFLTSQFWAITIVCPVLLHSILRREDRIETMMDVLRNFRDMSSSSDWGGKNDVSVGALRQMFAIETLFHEPSYFIV